MIQLTISKKKKKIASRIEIFLIRQFEKSSILASSHNLRGWKFLLNFEIAIVCSSREEFKPSEIVATFQTRCWYDFVSSLLRGKKKEKKEFCTNGIWLGTDILHLDEEKRVIIRSVVPNRGDYFLLF